MLLRAKKVSRPEVNFFFQHHVFIHIEILNRYDTVRVYDSKDEPCVLYLILGILGDNFRIENLLNKLSARQLKC